ncbi:type I 3-dehydroquinate dehydratase [Enteroscipio rubneri]|nr:type I 3-dehydroquinate dehydratase [Enteroscipio rubneri]
MEPLVIKGMPIGQGRPKIIISLMHAEAADACATAKRGRQAGVDCFEWRGDFCRNVHDIPNMIEDACLVADCLPHNPLLFTFRSVDQGGQMDLPVDAYVALNEALIETGCIDMVDIETWIGDAAVSDLIAHAHAHGVATVVSYHNFAGTPQTDWMVSLLTHIADLGADIPKIAVMARTAADTLRLLAATEEVARVHTDKPLLTMAMGTQGSISRLSGELFGSALTFCALEASSAPGQVDVARARLIMDAFHDVLA